MPEVPEADRPWERVGDTIRSTLFSRTVILDSGFAFCLGLLGPEKTGFGPKQLEKARLLTEAESAYRAGVLLRMIITLSPPAWPREVWKKDGQVLELGEAHTVWARDSREMACVKAFLAEADHTIDMLEDRGGREAMALVKLAGGLGAFKGYFRKLPAILALPKGVMFAHSLQERLSQEKSSIEAELYDRRGPGQVGNDAGGGLSLIAKARDLTDEIRRLEDKLEMMPNTSRYVVWCVDECHFYLEGDTDAAYASVSRSARMINLIATQGPSSIYSKMDEKVADALLINFPNRIVFRQADAEEAETCANLLGGKRRQEVVDRSITQSFDELHGHGAEGRGTAAGGSVQYSVKEEERFIVDPGILTELPAFQAVAVSWDGFQPKPAEKVWIKPDFLYMDPRVRNFNPDDPPKRSAEIPRCFKRGTDLYAMPALRLLQLGVYGSRSKP